jgi:hypothetical protein
MYIYPFSFLELRNTNRFVWLYLAPCWQQAHYPQKRHQSKKKRAYRLRYYACNQLLKSYS